MTPTEQQLYQHLKEQLLLLDKQIAMLQELKKQTEQDIVRMEQQQMERSQLPLF